MALYTVPIPPSPSSSRISNRPPSTSPGCSTPCFGKSCEGRGRVPPVVAGPPSRVASAAAALGSTDGAEEPPSRVAPSWSGTTSPDELSPLTGARSPPGPMFSEPGFLDLRSSIGSLNIELTPATYVKIEDAMLQLRGLYNVEDFSWNILFCHRVPSEICRVYVYFFFITSIVPS